MRTNSVVVFEPTFCDGTNLLQVIKQIGIQNVFSVGAVETLNVGILCWFAGLDMKQFDLFLFCPAFQSLRDQLWTIIHTNASGLATPNEQLFQNSHDPFSRE